MRARGLIVGTAAVLVGAGIGLLWMETTRPASSVISRRAPSSTTPSEHGSAHARASEAAVASSNAKRTPRRHARKPHLPSNPDASAFEEAMIRWQSRIKLCREGDAVHRVESPEEPLLLLDVQFHSGKLEIVDASFQNRAGISTAAADCIVNALRGEAIPSATAVDEEGSRMTVPFPVPLAR